MARIASMIQVNVKKNVLSPDDIAGSTSAKLQMEADGQGQNECVAMAAASIETWGGLKMSCSSAGSSVFAVDFGYNAVFML